LYAATSSSPDSAHASSSSDGSDQDAYEERDPLELAGEGGRGRSSRLVSTSSELRRCTMPCL
jgi:hypothetical protein